MATKFRVTSQGQTKDYEAENAVVEEPGVLYLEDDQHRVIAIYAAGIWSSCERVEG